MNDVIVQQMKNLVDKFQKEGIKGKEFDLIDKDQLVKEAAIMGENVKFSHASRTYSRDKEGYIAYYTFDDINGVSLNENDVSKNNSSFEKTDNKESSPKEPIYFYFRRGNPAQLMIIQPEQVKSAGSQRSEMPPAGSKGIDTTGYSALIDLVAGFRIKFAVEVEGTITQTNAMYVDNNRVTLMEVDFKQLIQEPARLEEIVGMARDKTRSAEEIKEILRKMPGIKIELSSKPRIWFE